MCFSSTPSYGFSKLEFSLKEQKVWNNTFTVTPSSMLLFTAVVFWESVISLTQELIGRYLISKGLVGHFLSQLSLPIIHMWMITLSYMLFLGCLQVPYMSQYHSHFIGTKKNMKNLMCMSTMNYQVVLQVTPKHLDYNTQTHWTRKNDPIGRLVGWFIAPQMCIFSSSNISVGQLWLFVNSMRWLINGHVLLCSTYLTFDTAGSIALRCFSWTSSYSFGKLIVPHSIQYKEG